MVILQTVYQALLYGFPPVPPETGAVLGMQNGIVSACLLDNGIVQNSRAIYTPKTEILNQTVRQWTKDHIQFCGIAHSHPQGQMRLSSGDIAYIREILTAMPKSIPTLFFPLVFPGEKILSFAAVRHADQIEILTDDIIIL